MNVQDLRDTAIALVAGDKGLLAMDESTSTCNKRFAGLQIPQTEPARRAYRELLVTTPGLGENISGAILYDKTIRQMKKDGTPCFTATGPGELARGGESRACGTELAFSPSKVQPGGAPWEVRCRD
jgi:fructose-bisphosphate aldolase, class I